MEHSGDAPQPDLVKVEKLLQSWAAKICESTNDIISSALGSRNNDFTSQGANGIFDDMRDRQSRIITTIQEAHSRQLEMLKTAVAEERKEFSRAQLIFEQSLKTKYDHVVDALQETIKAEHDSRLLRTVKSLESQARLESERAKQAFDIEHEVEVLLAKRLKNIIGDLRRSWEIEESGRIKSTEERLRLNYNILLEHMEAQLRLALQWQDDADCKWIEELDCRNRKQLDCVKMYEEKCKKMYETRLQEYMEKTTEAIRGYEEQLLEVGSALASEKSLFESRLRRIKLATTRWKNTYQQQIHERYRSLTDSLEDRYLVEMDSLSKEIGALKDALHTAQRAIDHKEKEIISTHSHHLGSNSSSSVPGTTMTTNKLRSDLQAKWDELKTSPQERIACLSALLDSATVTPQTLQLYEQLSSKLSDRTPIAGLANRKQFLEYKLKLSTNSGVNNAERADMIAELSEVKGQLDKLMRQYEKTHNEPYAQLGMEGGGGAGGAVLSPKRASVGF